MFISSYRNTTVVCAYSIEDIDSAFSTSKLKGYNSPLAAPRPGTVHQPNAELCADSFCNTYYIQNIY